MDLETHKHECGWPAATGGYPHGETWAAPIGYPGRAVSASQGFRPLEVVGVGGATGRPTASRPKCGDDVTSRRALVRMLNSGLQEMRPVNRRNHLKHQILRAPKGGGEKFFLVGLKAETRNLNPWINLL